MSGSAKTDTIALDARTLLIALDDGRSWLASIDTGAVTVLPVSAVARARPSIAASAIEGALYAGLTRESATQPGNRSECHAAPARNLTGYVRWLAGNAWFAAQTPGLFREAAQRFTAIGRADLAGHAARKADEEDGHAELALADLAALGLHSVAVDGLRPPSASAFAERFQSLVQSEQPIALFGFSYCMERMALERDRAFVESVRTSLPKHVRAMRFLKVHSALGSDSNHVVEQLALFESCARDELHCIVRAAFDTACMLGRQKSMDQAFFGSEIDRQLRGQLGEFAAIPTRIDRTRATPDASDRDPATSSP